MKFSKSTLFAMMMACSAPLSANMIVTNFDNAHNYLSSYTLDCAHWYVGANLGVSHLHDEKTNGSVNSVDENGPGYSIVGGYQFNSMLGAELGYTDYHNSRETVGGAGPGSTTIAQTEHYAVDLAAVGRYPLVDRLSGILKLGVAYSYANKIYTTGPSMSSGAGSLYWGLGFDYSLTQKIDFLAQFASARGNHLTGSSDLWSLGLTAALV